MTVAKFVQPNAATDSASQYKSNIDASIKVLSEAAADFAPHAQDTPNMTVLVDAGIFFNLNTGTLTTKTQQTTGTITAPVTNPRIDRIVLDIATAVISVVTGAENASPTAPSIPVTAYPIAQIALSVGQSSITNTNITDERAMMFGRLSDQLPSKVGLGAAPNGSWASGYYVLDMEAGGLAVDPSGNVTHIPQNAYYDGTNWRYKETGTASLLSLGGQQSIFYTAGSGSAGTIISFTARQTTTTTASTFANYIDVAGLVTAGATGGYQGANSINASSYFKDGADLFTSIGITTSATISHATAPWLRFNTSGAGANNKLWDLTTDLTNFYLKTPNDGGGSALTALQITRSGTTPTATVLPWGTVTVGADSSGEVGKFGVIGTAPSIGLRAYGGVTNEKWWDFSASATTLSFNLLDDSRANPVAWATVTRSGTTPGTLTLFPSIVRIESTAPHVVFYESDATTTNRRWRSIASGENFYFGAASDDGVTTANFWQYKRAGVSATESVSFATYLTMETTAPTLRWHDTDADAGEKWWDIYVNSGTMSLRTLSDAYDTPDNIMVVNLVTGNSDSIDFYADTHIAFWSAKAAVGATIPTFELYDSDGGSGQKRWVQRVEGETLKYQLVDDGQANRATWLAVDRSGDTTAMVCDSVSFYTKSVTQSNAAPAFYLHESDANTDQAYWGWTATGESFYGRIWDNSGAYNANFMQVERSGTGSGVVVDYVQFPSGIVHVKRGTNQPEFSVRAFSTTNHPTIGLYRSRNTTIDSLSGTADADLMGDIVAWGVDSTPTAFRNAADIRFIQRTSTSTTVDAYAQFRSNGTTMLEVGKLENTTTGRVHVPHSFSVGSPGARSLGGALQSGEINAQTIMDDGIAICYVFELLRDGRIDIASWDLLTPERDVIENGKTVRRRIPHDKARSFVSDRAQYMDIDAFLLHCKQNGHFPAMPSKSDYAVNRYTNADYRERMIETMEMLAVHIDNLNERIKLLEAA